MAPRWRMDGQSNLTKDAVSSGDVPSCCKCTQTYGEMNERKCKGQNHAALGILHTEETTLPLLCPLPHRLPRQLFLLHTNLRDKKLHRLASPALRCHNAQDSCTWTVVMMSVVILCACEMDASPPVRPSNPRLINSWQATSAGRLLFIGVAPS